MKWYSCIALFPALFFSIRNFMAIYVKEKQFADNAGLFLMLQCGCICIFLFTLGLGR
jgi:hypothetical protein